jgi:CheY-like chemotaxis protein
MGDRAGLVRDGSYILVVEDDPDLREGMTDLLELAGYTVRSAEHGRDALDLLADPSAGRPIMALVDLFMPIMDGWTFIEALRAQPHLADLPVVVMTASGPAALAKAPACSGQLAKPIDFAALSKVLDQALPSRLCIGA